MAEHTKFQQNNQQQKHSHFITLWRERQEDDTVPHFKVILSQFGGKQIKRPQSHILKCENECSTPFTCCYQSLSILTYSLNKNKQKTFAYTNKLNLFDFSQSPLHYYNFTLDFHSARTLPITLQALSYPFPVQI